MQATVRAADRPGDLGWVVQAHGDLYAREHGWDTEFERLVLGVVAAYAADHDPAREACWVAELDGRRVGCIMLVRSDAESTAKLRVLLVDPAARGHGLGRRLVGTCLDFAAAAGYRRVELWTTANLPAARHLYQEAGFALADEQPQHRFGHDVVGQTWARELPAA